MLFSENVILIEGLIEDFQGALTGEEMSLIENAVEKRQREFIAGRVCAKRALAKLGVECESILSGSKREPLWPSGIVGSITHTDTHVAAAVARASVVRSIGMDIELRERLKPEVWSLIFVDEERSFLEAIEDEADRNLKATIIFSAKECFYKYQFPLTHEWVGFQEASVSLLNENQFQVELHKNIADGFNLADRFVGSYQIDSERVMTALEG